MSGEWCEGAVGYTDQIHHRKPEKSGIPRRHVDEDPRGHHAEDGLRIPVEGVRALWRPLARNRTSHIGKLWRRHVGWPFLMCARYAETSCRATMPGTYQKAVHGAVGGLRA